MQATASRGVNDNVASVLMRAEVIQHMDPRSLARCLTTCTALRARHEKRAKPIDMCKGGMSAPPTSSERPQGPEEADSSDEEGTESFAGKTFHAFGGTGWR